MKCTKVNDLLSDYHHGELDSRTAAEVSGHLRTCAACAAAISSLENETRAYEAFAVAEASSLQIGPRTWESVCARVAQASVYPEEKGRPHYSNSTYFSLSRLGQQAAFAAVLVTLSVAGTLIAVRYWPSPPESMPRQQRGAADGPRAGRPDSKRNALEDALLAIQQAEQDYIQAINLLSSIVEKRKSSLDPRLAAALERNLRAIDQAIDSTRKAYRDRPQDPERALYMLRAYARKVELLQELVS